MEKINRGLVAVRTGPDSAYIGWRMLGTDPPEIAFNLYHSAGGRTPVKLNELPLTATTDYVHAGVDFSEDNAYFVRPVLNDVELDPSETFVVRAEVPVRQYLEVPLTPPAGGTANWCPGAAPSSYTYEANDGSIGDLDGDGAYEIVLKWEPTNAKDNSQSGCTGPVILDAYRLDGTRIWRINLGKNIRAGAHYTQFMVYDLDGDGRAEIAMKTADGTVDGVGNVIGDPNAVWANASGYILSGPEYLTVFEGLTGRALASVDYLPPRGSVGAWGDSYGNRVDRFLAGVAYLDGIRPSLVFARGYYTRTTLAAWDWRNGQLSLRWFFDSKDPNHPEYLAFEGQGNHQLSIADADGDGKDEIIYGSAVIDHDGSGLFSTGFGHGDAMHVSRFDPDNPDILVYGVHEINWITPSVCMTWERKLYGTTLYNARTGELVMATDECYKRDAGRGMAAALHPTTPGTYFWGGVSPGGLVNLKGQRVANAPGSTNFAAWWDADLMRELVDSNRVQKYDIFAGTTSTVLTATGCSSNNGTKATPVLSGDILGDWREEVIWRTADNLFLRIYTTTIPAANRMYTLLHDSQYRVALAWQNVAYNQPPWPSFYIGPGMTQPPQPDIITELDTVPPVLNLPATIRTEATGPDGAVVHFSVSAVDAVSGPVPVEVSVSSGSLFPLGATSVLVTATDAYGNTATGSFQVVVRDTTPPQVTLSSPLDGAIFLLNQQVAAAYECSDPVTGVALCSGTAASGAWIDTSSAGPKTFIITATDNAGNQTTKVVSYTVQYVFSGFSAPVVAAPLLNLANAGSVVPVKFQLQDATGSVITNVAAISSVVSYPVAPGTSSAIGPAEPVDSPGRAGIRFDPIANQFVLNWDLPRNWEGQWRILRVVLSDQTFQEAIFQLQ